MLNKHSFLFLLIAIALISCKNTNKTKGDTADDPVVLSTKEDTIAPEPDDHKSDTIRPIIDTPLFVSSSQLKTDDYIKQYPPNQKAALRRTIEELRKQWKDVPNPVFCNYKGNEFGDYHHVLFIMANGKVLDFGQAENNYAPYKLHELSGQYDDNPQFLGKKFRIYWEWKLSSFQCCDGEYGEANAYLPSITKLELVK